MTSRHDRICFGDFQTPRALAEEVCGFLRARSVNPRSIIEPTCGVGNFLLAAADTFSGADRLVGADVNDSHLTDLATAVAARPDADRFQLLHASFFDTDWSRELAGLPEPILVIGNPPWVTSATQGKLGSDNLPVKSNSHRRRGIDAITGQANFDVSEWILSRLCEALDGRQAVLAMLCKTAVARRVLTFAWQQQFAVRAAELHEIDTRGTFRAAVAANLLVAEFAPGSTCDSASIFPQAPALGGCDSRDRIGWRDGRLIANLDGYSRRRYLCIDTPRPGTSDTNSVQPLWRSGVKHDCAAVMELVERHGRFWNGLGEAVDLESECLFPLLKSGAIAAEKRSTTGHWLLLPQRFVGEDTRQLQQTAPRTWQYLMGHAARLDARRSSIYRRQPRFAVFGVGEYTFAPWKVVVSGFAKRLRFEVAGPRDGRPVVLDDTSYFLPCQTESAATTRATLLNSPAAAEFFAAFVFWDSKRPITAEVLRRLDLERLASDAHLSQRIDGALDDTEQVRMG